MKLFDQLQNPKVWGTVIPLLVSVGLFELTDSQVGDWAAQLAALFAAINPFVVAIMAQHGDNTANVEVARQVRLGPARERSLSEPRGVLVEADVAEQLTRIDNQIYGLRARILELERGRKAAGNPNRVVGPETWDRQAAG